MYLPKLLVIALTCLNANAQELNLKFDTKGNSKAKGMWVTVRYPSGWEVKDGERPNIVKVFSGEYNGMLTSLQLQILEIGVPIEKECNDMTVANFAEAFSDNSKNQIITNVHKINHEQKPAFVYELQSKTERAGTSFLLNHKIMSVCYKKTLISLWCSPYKFDRAAQLIISGRQQLYEASPLCFQYFNSLVLMDEY